MHILLENISYKSKLCCLVANISRLVNLDCVSWWLIILSNNCPSIPSALSSIHLVMVLAKRGTHVTFWTAASPKSSWQMSLAAGRIISSPVAVKGLLVLAMWLATKNDTLSADIFDEVVVFNNCSVLGVHIFFFWKISKACLLIQGALSPCGEIVLKVSWLRWITSRHTLYKLGLQNVHHLLQWSHNLNRTLGIFFKIQLSFCWHS